jgi:formate-dependent nitrite reductase membrane component NrfD
MTESRAEPGTQPRRQGKRGKGKGGERLMVPRAEFQSYYGRPVIKAPVWKTPDVPGYLFLGGVAGASSVLAASAQASGHPQLARNAKVSATAAIALSGVALVNDLGRPTRFLNMLRVFKTSSPMSVGSWLLAVYGPVSGAAAVSAVTGLLPRAGAAATAGAAVLGSGIATYTGALLCDTAVPAWHEAHREMPYLFAGSAASAAGGLGMLTAPSSQSAPAARFAALGAATELAAKQLLTRRLGDTAQPYHSGRPGTLLRAAEGLTVAGLAGSIASLAARHRAVKQVVGRGAGAALVAASALTRFGIFEAGQASAADPGYTVGPQRERINGGNHV